MDDPNPQPERFCVESKHVKWTRTMDGMEDGWYEICNEYLTK